MRLAALTTPFTAALVLCTLGLPAVVRAEDPITWHFDIKTEGQDVFWTSPTAVNNAGLRYRLSYELTKVEVTVKYLFWTFEVDITSQIPPEYLSGSEIFEGPLPITIFDGDLVYPEPPEPPGFSCHLVIGLDAAGRGYITITKVYLGQVKIELPGFGWVTADLKAIRMVGTITAQAFLFPLGDMNCDGAVNFDDIDPFVLALGGEYGYHAAYPNCDWLNGDCNADGTVDFEDIDPFVALLSG